MNDDLLYQLALTFVPHVGPVQAKILLNHCDIKEVFHSKKSLLEKIEGIGPVRAASIVNFRDFHLAEQQILFIRKYNIKPLFITDNNYPKRLLNCYDSPTLLFYKGDADLNAEKIVAVIGTRSNTEYGKHQTEKIIKELSGLNILVVSGLAFGIDAVAHKSSLKNQLPTLAVLAHGLDQIYPPEHNGLAKDIIRQGGGLLTEFASGMKPDKHNFPSRNRIVAGMSDAVIVIETGIKGGSMITAELANGYNKDVFALPGRINDPKSAGCNLLIRSNKAILLGDPAELIETMQWENKIKLKKERKPQRELFIELTAEEKQIVTLLTENQFLHIDELNQRTGLSNSTVASAILNLELQNLVSSLPGKRYQLQ